MAQVLHRRAPHRHRAPAPAGHVLRQLTDAGYPKVFNIEMDPHEDLAVAGVFGWAAGPMLEVVEKYKATLKKHPNPPAANVTKF